tara:strand:- start:119 stop:517 length:399 start_codon:yes stop_codon:yes gene_type:complete
MGKITTRKDGYQIVTIDGKIKFVHRLIAEEHISNPFNLPCINHINGNKSDNRIENLEWVSRRKNCEHARLNGLSELKLQGVKDLTKEQVLKIKELRNEGNTYKNISKQFNRDSRTIWDICNGKRYKEYELQL